LVDIKTIKQAMLQKLSPLLDKYSFKYYINEEELKIFLPLFCYLSVTGKNGKFIFKNRINFGFRFLNLEINYIIYGFILFISFQYLTSQIFTVCIALILITFLLQHNQLTQLKHQVIRWLEEDDI
jgi:hypothetical protein